jgi:hypothetical protein
MSRISLTKKEIGKLEDANCVLHFLTNNKEFKTLVKNIYGEGTKPKEIERLFSIFDKIERKISEKKERSEKKSSENGESPPKEIHFTKPVDTTRKSKMLAELVYDLDIKNLRYDQHKNTCSTDVRTMIASYIRKKNLRDPERGTRIDKNLRNLAPRTLENIDIIPKSDRKTVHDITKEILEKD